MYKKIVIATILFLSLMSFSQSDLFLPKVRSLHDIEKNTALNDFYNINNKLVLPKIKLIDLNYYYEYYQTGKASWYGPGFQGKKTANGEKYNMYGLTAAHKKLAFGTKVKVTNLKNNKSIIVRINDRGPFVKGRIIDLSKSARDSIGMDGIAQVKLEIIK